MCQYTSKMSATKDLLTITNIAYLVGAVYMIVVVVAGQASPYSFAGAVLCIISVPLALRKEWFFSVPLRVAAAAFMLTLFAAQIMSASANSSLASSFLVNGVFLLLFLGVFLSTVRDSLKKETKEEKEEEEKAEEAERKRREAKKLTYEV